MIQLSLASRCCRMEQAPPPSYLCRGPHSPSFIAPLPPSLGYPYSQKYQYSITRTQHPCLTYCIAIVLSAASCQHTSEYCCPVRYKFSTATSVCLCVLMHHFSTRTTRPRPPPMDCPVPSDGFILYTGVRRPRRIRRPWSPDLSRRLPPCGGLLPRRGGRGWVCAADVNKAEPTGCSRVESGVLGGRDVQANERGRWCNVSVIAVCVVD